jgi:hypothetical protein
VITTPMILKVVRNQPCPYGSGKKCMTPRDRSLNASLK